MKALDIHGQTGVENVARQRCAFSNANADNTLLGFAAKTMAFNFRRKWMSCMSLAMVFGVCSDANVLASDGPADNGAAVANPAEFQSRGSVSFGVRNEQKRFTYLPVNANRFNAIASTIWAQPVQGATETFAITFFSINLKKQTYPAKLPAAKTIGHWLNPLMAMATVEFYYVDSQGQEWAGPGNVYVRSFCGGGVLTGTFDALSLPATDELRPNVVVRGGQFSVKLDSAERGARGYMSLTQDDSAATASENLPCDRINSLEV